MAGRRMLHFAAAAALLGGGLGRIGDDVLLPARRPALEPVPRPESIPDELGYTPRQYAEDEERARNAEAKRERRRQRNIRIAAKATPERTR